MISNFRGTTAAYSVRFLYSVRWVPFYRGSYGTSVSGFPNVVPTRINTFRVKVQRSRWRFKFLSTLHLTVQPLAGLIFAIHGTVLMFCGTYSTTPWNRGILFRGDRTKIFRYHIYGTVLDFIKSYGTTVKVHSICHKNGGNIIGRKIPKTPWEKWTDQNCSLASLCIMYGSIM